MRIVDVELAAEIGIDLELEIVLDEEAESAKLGLRSKSSSTEDASSSIGCLEILFTGNQFSGSVPSTRFPNQMQLLARPAAAANSYCFAAVVDDTERCCHHYHCCIGSAADVGTHCCCC